MFCIVVCCVRWVCIYISAKLKERCLSVCISVCHLCGGWIGLGF